MPNPPQHCSFQAVLTMWCSACHTRLRRDRTCNTTGCENFRPSCRGSWLSSRNKTRSRTRQRDPQPPTPTPTPEDASVPQDHMTPHRARQTCSRIGGNSQPPFRPGRCNRRARGLAGHWVVPACDTMHSVQGPPRASTCLGSRFVPYGLGTGRLP